MKKILIILLMFAAVSFAQDTVKYKGETVYIICKQDTLKSNIKDLKRELIVLNAKVDSLLKKKTDDNLAVEVDKLTCMQLRQKIKKLTEWKQ